VKRKLFIISFSVLLAVGIAGTFWGSSIAEAALSYWDSCPRGEVNDPFPGDCNLYIDTNNDGYCDRSQPAPQVSTNSASSGSGATATSANNSPNVTITAPTVSGGQNTLAITPTTGTETAKKSGKGLNYYFVPILGVLVALYSITWILSARKIFATLLHRKIWNVVLLVSALVSALLGLILLINIEFGTNITLPFNMLFWHVEAGIALSVVAFFHIGWHWRYFAKILGMTKKPAGS
jgi:hypothetical protein